MTDPDAAVVTYLLQIADDNLVVSQRLAELMSTLHELEEDIAVANVCLDHLGQARNLYSYASTGDAEGRDEDAFAMMRDEREFFNAVLVEQPNGDFAQTMARQFFLDAYQVPLYEALENSVDHTLAGIAAKAVKEARYHLRHSLSWVLRMGDGTDESHRRMQSGIDAMYPFTADLFSSDSTHAQLVSDGVAADVRSLRQSFDHLVADVLTEATLQLPSDPYQRTGGRVGFHTEHLGHLLPEMQSLHRRHVGAEW